MRLTSRERRLAIALSAFVGAWVMFLLGVKPAVQRMRTLQRVIPEKQRTLEHLNSMSTQYLALRAALDDLDNGLASEEEFELLAFLEFITRESGLAEKVATMKQEVYQSNSKYREITVEVKLEGLTLKELVEFLFATKSSEHFLRVKSLYAKKSAANTNVLDAVVEISAVKIAGPI
ncbi:MAG: type II secretion system protein GspM [Planctomycetota bacterium]|jgi:hypothetical protein